MRLYSDNKDYKLYQGNMLDMLEVIDKESVDSIITDPPYELNFMGKGWDNSGIAFQVDTWKKCFEVLKPGGYLLAFGGSRTFHRIAVAIEDAGFEIRDTIMWLYGSGFPKSMDISKQIDKHLGIERQIIGKKEKRGGMKATFGGGDYKESALNITEPATDLAKQWQGWGTALKPSFEPIIVARKPFKGSLVDNVIEYGVGGINIDECRVNYISKKDKEFHKKEIDRVLRVNTPFNNSWKNCSNLNNANPQNELGRFPANTILTYDETDFDEVCGGFPYNKEGNRTKYLKQDFRFDISKKGKGGNLDINNTYNDSGSASRYFYCAKASKKDRDEGLDEFDDVKTGSMIANINGNMQLGGASLKGEYKEILPKKNTHPTVKPTELMQYLVRLVSPEGATILDPFNGSGSTGKAVMYENKERDINYKYIGIELTEEYLPISKARLDYVCRTPLEILKEQVEDVAEGQTNIFDFIGD